MHLVSSLSIVTSMCMAQRATQFMNRFRSYAFASSADVCSAGSLLAVLSANAMLLCALLLQWCAGVAVKSSRSKKTTYIARMVILKYRLTHN